MMCKADGEAQGADAYKEGTKLIYHYWVYNTSMFIFNWDIPSFVPSGESGSHYPQV